MALMLTLASITHLATTPVAYPVIHQIHDKLLHVAAFFVLAWLADLTTSDISEMWSWFFLLLVYGLILELIQAMIPGRFFSLLDLGANACGLLAYSFGRRLLRPSPT